jgi:hypothetical protein
MIIGATLGTTSTIWLVALFGLRFRISAAALPMLGIGAFLWLIARGKTRSLGALLAGFGLIFTGIDFLQTGMGGVSWNLDLEFERWKNSEISVFALNERIHKFHHGISRDLYAMYDPRGAELTVPGAIARGTLRQDEIDPSLLQNLAELIQFAKRRQQE